MLESNITKAGDRKKDGSGFESSLVAKMVKNLPAKWETWVRSLGWEDHVKKGMTTYSSILAWRVPWTKKPDGLQFVGHKESDMTEPLTLSLFH